MTERLPELLDSKGLQAELGITRAVAEKLMRRLPVVVFEDIRKTYVRRADVAALLDRSTYSKDEVPAVDPGHSRAYHELDKSNKWPGEARTSRAVSPKG